MDKQFVINVVVAVLVFFTGYILLLKTKEQIILHPEFVNLSTLMTLPGFACITFPLLLAWLLGYFPPKGEHIG